MKSSAAPPSPGGYARTRSFLPRSHPWPQCIRPWTPSLLCDDGDDDAVDDDDNDDDDGVLTLGHFPETPSG